MYSNVTFVEKVLGSCLKNPSVTFVMKTFSVKPKKNVNDFTKNIGSILKCQDHSVEFTDIYSHFLDKYYVKATVILQKLLKSWFHKKFWWRTILMTLGGASHFHNILHEF